MTVDNPQIGSVQPVNLSKVPPIEKPNGPHFQCKSSISIWFYLIFLFSIGLCLGLGILLFIVSGAVAGIIVGGEALVLVLIMVLIPKRLEVWDDSVKVCCFHLDSLIFF